MRYHHPHRQHDRTTACIIRPIDACTLLHWNWFQFKRHFLWFLHEFILLSLRGFLFFFSNNEQQTQYWLYAEKRLQWKYLTIIKLKLKIKQQHTYYQKIQNHNFKWQNEKTQTHTHTHSPKSKRKVECVRKWLQISVKPNTIIPLYRVFDVFVVE